jgi:hypothetical protein
MKIIDKKNLMEFRNNFCFSIYKFQKPKNFESSGPYFRIGTLGSKFLGVENFET